MKCQGLSKSKGLVALLFLCLFIACKKEEPIIVSPENPPTQRLLLKYVFDFNNTLRYAFVYSDQNRLEKCRVYDDQGQPEGEIQFTYTNGRLASYIHSYFWYHDVDLNMHLYYDSLNRLSYFAVNQGFTYFNGFYDYGSSTKVQRLFRDSTTLAATFDYAGGPNCVTYSGHRNGTITNTSFTYDQYKKPDFGLEQIYPFSFLHNLNETEELAQALSKHNMTQNLTSGTTITYTYNADRYPLSMETRRNGQLLPNRQQYKFTYQPLN